MCLVAAQALDETVVTSKGFNRLFSEIFKLQQTAVQVVYFKNHDLRLADHEPFFNALKSFKKQGKVICLFIHEPLEISKPYRSRAQQEFLFECLSSLDKQLQALGGYLVQRIGKPHEVLAQLHRQHGLTEVHSHRESSTEELFERDKQTAQMLQSFGVKWSQSKLYGVARGSEPFIGFVRYADQSMREHLKAPAGQDLYERFEHGVKSDPLGAIPKSAGNDKPGRLKGGLQAALEVKEKFFNVSAIKAYPYRLSNPNTSGASCSRISPYLSFGVVSDRQVLQWVDQAVHKAHAAYELNEFKKFESAARFYIDRLSWRHARISEFEKSPWMQRKPVIEAFLGIKDANRNIDLLNAWFRGQTGYPFVDATMRWLEHDGYVSMRLRAMTTSFCAHLLWQPTEDIANLLGSQFVDLMPAIHFPLVRLVSGETQFEQLMVYSPVLNSKKYDERGTFIKRWCPELSKVPAEHIHEPWLMPQALQEQLGVFIGENYPAPIVDYATAMREAKAKLHRLRSENSQIISA